MAGVQANESDADEFSDDDFYAICLIMSLILPTSQRMNRDVLMSTCIDSIKTVTMKVKLVLMMLMMTIFLYFCIVMVYSV